MSTDEATWVFDQLSGFRNAIILPATNWLGQLLGQKAISH